MGKTNVDYWERIIKNPSKNYRDLFENERVFLRRVIQPGSRVLDIGCGCGRMILEFKDIPSEIVGIDTDNKSIECAKVRFSKEDKIKIVKGSAFKIPFEKESFDCVLLMMTFVNFSEDKINSLFEMRRVLRKSGSIVLSVYSDNAFDERKRVYKEIGVPVDKIVGTKFIFRKSIGANESEQFSLSEIEILCNMAGLKIVKFAKTNIGLIFQIKKR